jgi:adenylate cyclase
MGFEIERKFLVRDDHWQPYSAEQTHIRQAYLASDGKASIRVRVKQKAGATLTIKSREPHLRRLELEYPIPALEAEALIQLRHGAVIEKVRHRVPWGDQMWEVDVFSGENDGLVIAEIELKQEHDHVELPPWIGAEVTGQRQYYNSALVQRPFSAWPSKQQEGPTERLA